MNIKLAAWSGWELEELPEIGQMSARHKSSLGNLRWYNVVGNEVGYEILASFDCLESPLSNGTRIG